MRITSLTSVKSEIIETDDSPWPTYRRSEYGNWEQLMGDSWEEIDDLNGELEAAYQDYMDSPL